MSTRINDGIEQNLISFNEDNSRITYIHQGKTYNYKDPEEQVRVEIFLQLILDYGYKNSRIQLEVIVPRRTPSDLADIVVFSDDTYKTPHIVVECKRKNISEAEFTQAIEQGFGNANSLSAPYLWVTNDFKSISYNVKDYAPMEREKNIISRIPKFGQKGVSKANYYKGGVDEKGEIAFDLKKVEQKDLTDIFSNAHKALWAGGKRNPSEAFDELDKVIFCKIWDERTMRKKGEPYDFQVFTGENPETLLSRIKKIYDKGKEKDPEVFKEPIRLSASELKIIVDYLAPINLHGTDLDSKGRAFETFMGSFFRGEFGQYFTPREIVDFIIKVLPITNESYVLDTSCGSGGFLLYALDKIRKKADKLADEGYFEHNSAQHRDYWHTFAEKYLYGIEISEGIARTAKMNMIIHDDGHTNVVACDGLASADYLPEKHGESKDELEARIKHNRETIQEKTGNFKFKYNHFDFIVTNPPFGSQIKQTESAYLKNYKLGNKEDNWINRLITGKDSAGVRTGQNTEVLFLEQCHRYLKVGGYLAIVIPDGILTNSSMQSIRDWIEESYRIVAVISLPQSAFMANGAGVKSSILFLRKNSEDQTKAIIDAKIELQQGLWNEDRFGKNITTLIAEKNKKIKELFGLSDYIDSAVDLATISKKDLKELEQSEEYKQWKSDLTSEYNERIDETKEDLDDAFRESFSKKQANYPIYMALAENIGYDAAARKITGETDLDNIAPELTEFIKKINSGKDIKTDEKDKEDKSFFL